MLRHAALIAIVLASGCKRYHVTLPDDCVGEACASACPEGQRACDGSCVNLSSDTRHCGSCGHGCPAGEFCTLGECSLGCDEPLAVCDGPSGLECIDTRERIDNCGGCGSGDASHVCTASAGAGTSPVCDNGTCGWDCLPGRLDCHDAPAATDGEPTCLARDADNCHCGSCKEECDSWDFEEDTNTCVNTGPTSSVCCGGGCIKLTSDKSCGTSCADVADCSVSGRHCCAVGVGSFGCVDESTDIDNCHGCDHACFGLSPACCADGCADLAADPNNCGDCNVRCFGLAPACCPGIFNSYCVDADQDVFNCGACGHSCYDFCSSSSIIVDCSGGFCFCG